MKRTAFAFLLSPIIGVAVGDIVVSVAYQWSFGLFTFFGAFVGYPLTLLIGLPAFLILKKTRQLSLGICIAIGFIIGVAGWGLWSYPYSAPSFEVHSVSDLVFALVSGITAGLAFWILGVHRNQDLILNSTVTPNGARQ